MTDAALHQTATSVSRTGLAARQVVILTMVGASVWLAAALILRLVGPMGAYEGLGRAWLYLAIVPGTVPVIFLAGRLASLRRDQFVSGVALALMTATLLDGLALAWFPGLYGATASLQAGAGGAILWGAGVALALGFVFNRS